MTNAAIDLSAYKTDDRARPGHALPTARLKVVVMDDNAFDRKAILRISEKSSFDLDLIETSTIAETRAAIAEHDPDVVFLDYRVPDGDGIDFSAEIARSLRGAAPPVVMVTGEGDEGAAIRSLRAGVVDYLPKNDLSVELFEHAVAKSLELGARGRAQLARDVETMRRNIERLRQETHRNMHLARAYLLPMAEYAWSAIRSGGGEDWGEDVMRLSKVTRRLTALLDDTLVTATTGSGAEGDEPVDLYGVLEDTLEAMPVLRGKVEPGPAESFPVVPGKRNQLRMLIAELCREALESTPGDRMARIRIECASDVDGNPILCLTDNGAPLAERGAKLAASSGRIGHDDAAPVRPVFTLSICQRLAELNGGQLRIRDAEDGGCVTMIRFPRKST